MNCPHEPSLCGVVLDEQLAKSRGDFDIWLNEEWFPKFCKNCINRIRCFGRPIPIEELRKRLKKL